jgi:hypothetical protein
MEEIWRDDQRARQILRNRERRGREEVFTEERRGGKRIRRKLETKESCRLYKHCGKDVKQKRAGDEGGKWE